MSNSLGTLWFGADIDLTALKQKIQQGNKEVLDALKIDYDPQSYQQMVSKLKSRLASETFEIKLSANTNHISQNIQSAMKGGGGQTMIDDINKRILLAQERVNSLKHTVSVLHNEFLTIGGDAKRNAWLSMRTDLAGAQRDLSDLIARRNAYNQSAKDTARANREASAAARQLTSDSLRLNTTLAGGIHISTQLGSALSSVFAIHAAREFLDNVIEIGGQLEKQRISIGAILGDVVKANHLFEQIKGLALKSPFGVVELDQYTKQLSAYGFKYSELYDMTKRLADISAGAGQDIGRLTLALGHVRSATYLTGITLRQFSMNNIPMLKMLADYYTELEGKIVSTAEVQKRISKRQVSYEDVIEQIRRLTNEGGIFYNMQEKISESLSAKFKNLRDAMDIMYGELAESNIGDMLKSLASGLTQLSRHWKEIGAVMGTVATLFTVNRIATGLLTSTIGASTAATYQNIMANKQLEARQLRRASLVRTLSVQEKTLIANSNILTASDVKQALAAKTLTRDEALLLVTMNRLSQEEARLLVGTKGITAAEIQAAAAANTWAVALKNVWMSLKSAFLSIGRGTWATLAIGAGVEIYQHYNSWVERINDKANEMKDLVKSRILDLQKMQKTLDGEGKPKDNAALKARIDDMRQVLANSENYTKTLDEQLKKASALPEKYDILADAIKNATEENKKMYDVQDSIAGMIKVSGGDFWALNPLESAQWFYTDDINKNMSQTLESYKDLRKVIDTAWAYRDAIKAVIEEMEKSGEISADFAKELNNAPFEEQIQILATSGYWKTIQDRIASTDNDFVKFSDNIQKAAKGVEKKWNEIINDDIPRMMRKKAEDFDGDEKAMRDWCLNNIDDFRIMLDGIADQIGAKEPSIRRRLKKLFYDYVRFAGLSEGLAAGAAAGAAVFSGDTLERLLKDKELADIKDDASGADTGSTNKRDEQLEAAKTKLQEYKAFLSEYKKYRDMYSKEDAINILKPLFPNLKDSKGKFLGGQLVDNYVEMLDKLRNSLAMTTEARKKFFNEVGKTSADTLFDMDKEAMKESVSTMKDYIKQMEDQWKLYRDVMKKTGNKVFAELSFNDGVMWDEVSKKMLEEFNTKGKEKGVMPVNFHWRMNEKELKESLRDAKGVVQEDLVSLAQEIQKIIRANYVTFIKDSADAYGKALTQQQKLNELIRQKNDLERRAREYNGTNQAVKNGYQIQIESLDRQIADQQWAAFKETNDWGRIFANLDRISTSTLRMMLDKLHEVAPSINESVEATKALYEAIDKIEEKLAERNPFSTIFNSVQHASRLRQLLRDVPIGNGITLNEKSAKYYGLRAGKNYTRQELNDLLEGAEEDFGKGLEGLAKDFKAVQDSLQPVIDLLDQLGEEDLSNFFSMGSNALGSAANVSQGLKTLGLENLGPYGAAAAAAISVTTSLLAMHDQSLQKEIEASQQRQREMENLTKNLEKALERSLSGIYNLKASDQMLNSLDKYASLYGASSYYDDKKLPLGLEKQLKKNLGYVGEDTMAAIKEAKETKLIFDATYASLLAQRDEIKHQMQMEEDKKKSDSQKIDDYKQQLIEIEDSIHNIAADMAKSLYDIDFKSWAHDLAQAIVNAWASGEDAAEAYKKKVGDILKDLGAKMIVERFISTAVDPIMEDFLKKYKEDNGMLTDQGLAIIAKMYEQGEAMAAEASAFMDGIEKVSKQYGADLKDRGTSTSMSAGIKSITENTADLLASYINAIRADVSVIRLSNAEFFPQILSVIGQCSAIANTQVQLQTQIAANTRRNAEAAERIYNILHGISPDGMYVRVK